MISLALVRFDQHPITHGHFETLLQSQLLQCEVDSLSYTFLDLSFGNIDQKLSQFRDKLDLYKVKHVYFEWLHDIPSIQEIDSILFERKISWSVLASVSEFWNLSNAGHKSLERMKHLSNAVQLKNVFVWDKYIIEEIGFSSIPFTVVNDFQDTTLDELRYGCCDWVNKAKRPLIGVVGQLYGYRGVTNVIRIALTRPNLSFILWGSGRWSSVKKIDKFLLSKVIPKRRLFVSDDYKSTDSELNHVFKHIDALYIDGSRYPNPSGIVTRARHFGIPTLVESGLGYYSVESKNDKGISLDRYVLLSSKAIRSRINQLTKQPPVTAPTLLSQVQTFVESWKLAINR